MNTQGHYIVDFDPFAVRFPESFFVEGIRWYGLAYLAGFVIAYLLLNLYPKFHHTEKLDKGEVFLAQFTDVTTAIKINGAAEIYTKHGKLMSDAR